MIFSKTISYCFGVAVLVIGFAVSAQSTVKFGDDASAWSHDGECDDPRFKGEGMATTLLDEDRKHDATDCQDLYDRGRIALAKGGDDSATTIAATLTVDDLEFGDNSSEWARDGECDDPRFEGAGAAETLVIEDLGRDAKDCRSLFERGQVRLNPKFELPGVLVPGSEEQGRLDEDDATLESGEYSDTYTFEAQAGEAVILDLHASEFDPYLIVRTPTGEQFDNDDYNDDTTRSSVKISVTETGTHIVRVTSYEAGEVGAYTLRMRAQVADAGSSNRNDELQAGVTH